jgi:hypothetical protein
LVGLDYFGTQFCFLGRDALIWKITWSSLNGLDYGTCPSAWDGEIHKLCIIWEVTVLPTRGLTSEDVAMRPTQTCHSLHILVGGSLLSVSSKSNSVLLEPQVSGFSMEIFLWTDRLF